MSEEEVVNELDIRSIDPEVITKLSDFRNDAIESCVGYYSQYFDKVFNKLIQKLDKNEEKLRKFSEIKDKYIKDYENYIERCFDQQIKQMFKKPKVIRQLSFVSDNRRDLDLIDVQKAIHPFKHEFVQQLKHFEQLVNERHETKTKQLSDLNHNLIQALDKYESNRKSLQKKVLSIVNELESIEMQDLEVNTEGSEPPNKPMD